MLINLRTSKTTYEIEVEDNATIADLKNKLEEKMEDKDKIAAKDQKYILFGKILKDEQQIKDINMGDNSSIFVAGTMLKKTEEKKEEAPQLPPQNQFYQQPYPAAAGSSANMGYPAFSGIPGSMNNMGEQIDMLLKNKDLMDSYINMMCGNAPPEQKENMKQMMMSTMERLKNNPEEMNAMMQQAANNPEAFRMFNGGMNTMPMSPPGYPQPMYPYQQPYFYPPRQQFTASPSIPCSHGFYPREEADYSEQAKVLVEMGYTNDTLNKEALKMSKGDISLAVALLIEWMNKR